MRASGLDEPTTQRNVIQSFRAALKRGSPARAILSPSRFRTNIETSLTRPKPFNVLSVMASDGSGGSHDGALAESLLIAPAVQPPVKAPRARLSVCVGKYDSKARATHVGSCKSGAEKGGITCIIRGLSTA